MNEWSYDTANHSFKEIRYVKVFNKTLPRLSDWSNWDVVNVYQLNKRLIFNRKWIDAFKLLIIDSLYWFDTIIVWSRSLMLWSKSIICYKSDIKLPENFSENYSILFLKSGCPRVFILFPRLIRLTPSQYLLFLERA